MTITSYPSPNFNSDRYIIPIVIVLHWTAGWFKPSVEWLCKPAAQVSAHYVVDRTGDKVYQLVDLNRRAWHCNPSWHPIFQEQQISGLNSYSIGIEIEGPPSMLPTSGWSDNLISSLIDLCSIIKGTVPTISGITDHSTICPQGKQDVLCGTGIDKFPWDALISKSGLADLATPEIRKQVKQHYGMPV